MGGRLRQKRGSRVLQEIADAAGISPSHIQRYEEGRIPRGDILDKLAAALGVSSRWLLTGQAESLYKKGGGGEGRAAEAPESYLDPKRMQLVKAVKRFALDADDDLVKALLENVKAFKELMERRQKLEEK